MLHEYRVIYSVRYYPRFSATAVGLGTYYPWIRRSICTVIFFFIFEHGNIRVLTFTITHPWRNWSSFYFYLSSTSPLKIGDCRTPTCLCVTVSNYIAAVGVRVLLWPVWLHATCIIFNPFRLLSHLRLGIPSGLSSAVFMRISVVPQTCNMPRPSFSLICSPELYLVSVQVQLKASAIFWHRNYFFFNFSTPCI